jgi:hypothetical protein
MTAHSPVGLHPAKYAVRKVSETIGSFANNDIDHKDPGGADHESFGFGLKKALFNYMHGTCFDYPLQKWFDFKVPKTTIAPDFIIKAVDEPEYFTSPNNKIVWLGNLPKSEIVMKSKKGNHWEVMTLSFQTKKSTLSINVDPVKGNWLVGILKKLMSLPEPMTWQMVKDDYVGAGLEDFELFWDNKPVSTLYKAGLLRL